ncbi:MAG: DNA methyltransferase [Nitrospirota bacterium]
MSENLNKLKKLLAELFQLDQADLDFGIYRIMNAKRDEITRFLDNDLLPQVEEAFREYRSADRVTLQAQLDEAIEQAKKLGADPETLPRVKELREMLSGAVDVTALENEVYSHLYNFFRRYYSEGDFISLRRYKEGVYAIPYEGEEVKLYWANHDQYYIKTSENFRNYTFKLPSGKKVTFKIVEAETAKDNIKAANGNERRFMLCAEEPLKEENGELFIRFVFEADPEKRKQKDINDKTIEAVLAAEGFSEWKSELARKSPTEKDPDRTLLEKHLTDYTAKNTFDYFIHKDLGGFLRRELDFYIKNEVMHLDDVENETAPRVEQYLSKIKVIRKIAHKLIEFLAQIENFQKKLWLKKKFVVETNYCVTLDRVPEELYPEIAANEAQREEWVKLFAIDEIKGDLAGAKAYSKPLTVEFLKANPFLVVDTKHFDQKFKDRLLASFENIEANCNGLLIRSENFQAINLLKAKYSKKIKCIHIDPPYNTQTSGFLYKNDYQHSSWLAMMQNRIAIGLSLLSTDGAFLCHIDENEYEVLHLLFTHLGIPDGGTIVWDKKNPMLGRKGIATQHEYVLWRAWDESSVYLRPTNVRKILEKVSSLVDQYGGVTEDVRREFASWISNCEGLTGGERAYRFIDNDGRIFQSVAMGAPEPRTDPKFHIPLVHPVTRKECPVPSSGWSRAPETLKELMEKGEIIFGADETVQPRRKVFLTDNSKRQLSSVISDSRRGKNDVDKLGLEFPYCHPVSLYDALLGAAAPDGEDIVFDYFAGSGTTGHSVINLNREEGARRKFLLAEIESYFDFILLSRIKKVIYSKDWKNGKPVSREGISHMFKYIRLESYEDTLNNLVLRRTDAQQKLLGEHPEFREGYMLSYMLDVESRDSLLNIDAFEDPFNYKLNISSGTVGETKPTTVDLIETFNYLLGLTVHHIDHINGFRVVTGTRRRGDKGTGGEEKVLIIWRNLKEKSNEDLDEFFRRQEYNPKDMEFDLIYVNGDNNLENLRREDETWKVRLIEEDFKRLMFDVEDV